VKFTRAVFMLPVAVHVPGVCAVAIATGVSLADLLNAAKVSRTPTEQRTKPIKTRGLKKADREADCFFRAITSSCASEPCRSRISLRKEGEVALPESPNGFVATAVSAYAEKCQNVLQFHFNQVDCSEQILYAQNP
jgi:hypothetical protein